MSQGTYYGNQFGAVINYARSGSGKVTRFAIGRVHRYSAEEQAIGSGVLRFTKTAEIKNTIVAGLLHSLKMEYHLKEISHEGFAAQVDRLLSDQFPRQA